jgi:DNA-binding SARP family transcriptional activator
VLSRSEPLAGVDSELLALYGDGRQREALTAYQHARRVLIDELGTEPRTELRKLHQRILTADPRSRLPRLCGPQQRAAQR